MKLWLVLHILGKVAVVWSIPDDVPFPECQRVAIEQKWAVEQNVTVNGVRASDMEFRCEWHDDPPLAEGENP